MTTLRPALRLLILWPVFALWPMLAAAQSAAPPPSQHRLRDFVDAAIISPGPYLLSLGGGILDQISGFPEEWNEDNGFAKRTAARVGSSLASDAIGHSVAAMLHHRVRYEPCSCSGGWSRTMHALSRGFVTRHDDGGLVMNSSLFIAKFGAAAVADAWYPQSYDGPDIAREGAAGIGVSAGLNVFREFAPELKRLIGIR